MQPNITPETLTAAEQHLLNRLKQTVEDIRVASASPGSIAHLWADIGVIRSLRSQMTGDEAPEHCDKPVKRGR